MAAPKRKLSKSKTNIRKQKWKNRAEKKVFKALQWAKLLLRKL